VIDPNRSEGLHRQDPGCKIQFRSLRSRRCVIVRVFLPFLPAPPSPRISTMKKQYLMGFALVVLFASSAIRSTQGVTPIAEESVESRRWVTAKFDGVQTTTKPKAGLVVLANHDRVQLNNRNGRPMRLGEREFRRAPRSLATDRWPSYTIVPGWAKGPAMQKHVYCDGFALAMPFFGACICELAEMCRADMARDNEADSTDDDDCWRGTCWEDYEWPTPSFHIGGRVEIR
jgi:hypothetical protein